MVRDVERTRTSILKAAQIVFTEKGYDDAGVREIARLAGCNSALINRYFESKQGLFEAAILTQISIDDMVRGSYADFVELAALIFASKTKGKEFDATQALIRSAGSAAVSPLIARAVHRQVIVPLSNKITGPDAAFKASLAIACLFGFDIMKRLLNLDVIAQTSEEVLAVNLRHILSALGPSEPDV